MGKKVYFPAKARWAKLRPADRDIGKNLPEGSDTRLKIEAEQGHYLLNAYIDRDTKKAMIDLGIPNKGMVGQLFKEDDTGELWYKCKRPHFNPRLKNRDTGEMGVVNGAPVVYKTSHGGVTVVNNKPIFQEEDATLIEWDWEEDGLIGNDSDIIVKLDVWDGKIVTFEGIIVVNHVKYEAQGGGF